MTTARTRRRWLAAAAALAALGLAACSGVPANSSPQVIKRVGVVAPSNNVTITPLPGVGPREIVSEFLSAVGSSDTAARSFLTADAQAHWSDTTATVLQSFTISNFDNGAIVVSGQQVGALVDTGADTGAYTPVLQGDGNGGPPLQIQFGLVQVKGQWRINSLQNGIVLSAASFNSLYTQHQLYFYDLDQKYLVPDPRFSSLADPSALANWLVQQLAAGPTPAVQNAVTTEFPAQSDPGRIVVSIGNPTTIALPGANALPGPTRSLLAGQLANTLAQVTSIQQMQILDSGRAVTIPLTGATTFSALDFANGVTDPVQEPSLFYINRGGVVDEKGHALAGNVGSGAYGLSSAALATVGSGDLRVAGVSGNGAGGRLYIGTLHGGLKATSVHGDMSRPAWVPGRDEAWVGAGASLRRCTLSGTCTVTSEVAVTGSVPRGTIGAVRFSPEGSRIAMVIDAPDGSAQVWVGVVVRTATQVRVDGLTAITPVGIAIRDVAWNDPLKLFVIGSSSANIYEVQVDGSLWTPRAIAGLPQAADSITVAENQDAWVSAGPTIWVQRSGTWASPSNGQTPGVNPVYLE